MLIFNADDYGLTLKDSERIIELSKYGIVKSTTIVSNIIDHKAIKGLDGCVWDRAGGGGDAAAGDADLGQLCGSGGGDGGRPDDDAMGEVPAVDSVYERADCGGGSGGVSHAESEWAGQADLCVCDVLRADADVHGNQYSVWGAAGSVDAGYG